MLKTWTTQIYPAYKTYTLGALHGWKVDQTWFLGPIKKRCFLILAIFFTFRVKFSDSRFWLSETKIMAGRQLLAVSGARWAWYSTEEHLPDDLEPIGTHLGPKQQTDKLFFSTRLIATPGPLLTTTNSYDLTNFGSFFIFWPRLVAHRAWCTTQEHLLDDSRPIGTHLGPKHGTRKFFFKRD